MTDEQTEDSTPHDSGHRHNILTAVAASNAFFKSQQLGEKDLTFEEKWKIAESLLDRNVSLFLQRYWKFIDDSDTAYFQPYSGDYEVNFYLSEISKLKDSKSRATRVKNRRYEALKSMVNTGSYFSEGEMKKRNPLLYDQLVGQYLSEDEKTEAARQDGAFECSFSSFLMRCFDKSEEQCLFNQQQEKEDAILEEEDDDESESEEEYVDVQENRPKPSELEKEMFRNEFKNIMYENFLAGKDLDFDYSTVDDNAEYDSVEQRGIDEEEKYFDDESPGAAEENMECDGVGGI